jgi:hypothetical protein
MKQKLLFSFQVFTTLILFLAIFMTYMIQSKGESPVSTEKNGVSTTIIQDESSSSGLYYNPFTMGFEEVSAE